MLVFLFFFFLPAKFWNICYAAIEKIHPVAVLEALVNSVHTETPETAEQEIVFFTLEFSSSRTRAVFGLKVFSFLSLEYFPKICLEEKNETTISIPCIGQNGLSTHSKSLLCAWHGLILCPGAQGPDLVQTWQMDSANSACSCWFQWPSEAGSLALGLRG